MIKKAMLLAVALLFVGATGASAVHTTLLTKFKGKQTTDSGKSTVTIQTLGALSTSVPCLLIDVDPPGMEVSLWECTSAGARVNPLMESLSSDIASILKDGKSATFCAKLQLLSFTGFDGQVMACEKAKLDSNNGVLKVRIKLLGFLDDGDGGNGSLFKGAISGRPF